MNIGIDYDETYTLDKRLWDKIINLFLDSGHKVYCVTKRYKHLADDIRSDMKIPIIYATKSKMEAVAFKNISIDVWIDDKPQSIYPYRLRKPLNKGFQRW